jgi:hypothetical protein
MIKTLYASLENNTRKLTRLLFSALQAADVCSLAARPMSAFGQKRTLASGVARLEPTLNFGCGVLELYPEGFDDLQSVFRRVRAVCVSKSIRNVANDVGKQDAPGGGFIASLRVPHPYVQAAVQPLLSDPPTDHLDGVFVALRRRAE